MELCALCKRRRGGNVDPLWDIRRAGVSRHVCDVCWRVSMVAVALGAGARLVALRDGGAPAEAIAAAETQATAAWNRAELAARIDREAHP